MHAEAMDADHTGRGFGRRVNAEEFAARTQLELHRVSHEYGRRDLPPALLRA